MIKNYLTSLKQEFSGYNTAKLMKDIMAGLTVCAVLRTPRFCTLQNPARLA